MRKRVEGETLFVVSHYRVTPQDLRYPRELSDADRADSADFNFLFLSVRSDKSASQFFWLRLGCVTFYTLRFSVMHTNDKYTPNQIIVQILIEKIGDLRFAML